MKRIFFLFFLLLGWHSHAAVQDTISYWHVKLGDEMLGDFNALAENPEVNLIIKKGDNPLLSVQYFSDTPCACDVYLWVEGDGKQLARYKKRNGNTLFEVDPNELRQMAFNEGVKDLKFYMNFEDFKDPKIFLFTLTFKG